MRLYRDSTGDFFGNSIKAFFQKFLLGFLMKFRDSFKKTSGDFLSIQEFNIQAFIPNFFYQMIKYSVEIISETRNVFAIFFYKDFLIRTCSCGSGRIISWYSFVYELLRIEVLDFSEVVPEKAQNNTGRVFERIHERISKKKIFGGLSKGFP